MIWSRPLRGVVSVVAVVGVAGVLGGCGDKGDSGAAGSSGAASTSATPSIDPKLRVKVPLPTADLLKNTCSMVTPKQAAVIGLEAKGEFRNVVAPACQWVSSGSRQNFAGLSALPQNKGGISDIFDQKADEKYFIPTAVDGYPAVYAAKLDARPSGSCSLWVGVTDELAVSASADIGTGHNRSKPCTIALKVAQAMVATLKTKL